MPSRDTWPLIASVVKVVPDAMVMSETVSTRRWMRHLLMVVMKLLVGLCHSAAMSMMSLLSALLDSLYLTEGYFQ